MDFLDELKKEADEAKTKRDEIEAGLRERTDRFLQEAAQMMQELYEYLQKLLKTLEGAGLDVRAEYEVEGAVLLEGLVQGNYMLITEDVDDIQELIFQYECVGDQTVVFQAKSRVSIQNRRDYLWSHGLRFDFNEKMGGAGGKEMKGDFHLEPRVPIQIKFEVNELGHGIRVTIKNLEGLGQHAHTLKLKEVNSKFMDQLARAIVRKPNELDKLVGNSLSNTMRMRLKDALSKVPKRAPRESDVKEKGSGFLSTIRTMLKK